MFARERLPLMFVHKCATFFVGRCVATGGCSRAYWASGQDFIPNVQSWTKVFHETVPWPHVLQGPHDDIKDCVARGGGVNTQSIPVREEPLRIREVKNEMPWVDQYMERDNMLVVQGQRKKIQGMLTSEYKLTCNDFTFTACYATHIHV